jgi:hypothetical protein
MVPRAIKHHYLEQAHAFFIDEPPQRFHWFNSPSERDTFSFFPPFREVREDPQEVQRVRNKMWDESRGRFREGGEDHNLQSRDRHSVEPGIEGNHFDLAILDDILEEPPWEFDTISVDGGHPSPIPILERLRPWFEMGSPQEKQKRLNKEWLSGQTTT